MSDLLHSQQLSAIWGGATFFLQAGVDQNVPHEDIININQLARMYIVGRRCRDSEVFLSPLIWDAGNPLKSAFRAGSAIHNMHTLY